MEFIYNHRTIGRGAEGVHIASLVRGLEMEGHSVTLLSPPGIDPLKTAGDVPVDKGVTRSKGFQGLWKWISCHTPQIVFELMELGYNFYLFFMLLPILKRQRSAVYYERAAFFLFMGVFLAKWYSRPVIIEVNEVTGIKRARGHVLVSLAQWLERKVFERADAILTVSSFLKKEVLLRGGREGRVHVIPNAVDSKWFEITAEGKSVRKDLGLDGTTVVGFVGWFDHWDRLDVLVDIVKELGSRYPELRLLLVGDGPVTQALKAKVQELSLEQIVIMTGPVPRLQVPSYIEAMDICVLPHSNQFGSPIVLFEFMAKGKAIVAPDLLPILDVIEDHVTGLIIKAGDPACLRQAIAQVVEDTALRLQLGARAREKAFDHHTWEANAKRVAVIAKELLTLNERNRISCS